MSVTSTAWMASTLPAMTPGAVPVVTSAAPSGNMWGAVSGAAGWLGGIVGSLRPAIESGVGIWQAVEQRRAQEASLEAWAKAQRYASDMQARILGTMQPGYSGVPMVTGAPTAGPAAGISPALLIGGLVVVVLLIGGRR